jgi:basic membrane protein A
MRPFLLLALLLAFATSAAVADDAAPGIVYAQGAKFDKSFNEVAYTGTERFKAETGVAYHEVEITNDSQRVQALSTPDPARRAGCRRRRLRPARRGRDRRRPLS